MFLRLILFFIPFLNYIVYAQQIPLALPAIESMRVKLIDSLNQDFNTIMQQASNTPTPRQARLRRRGLFPVAAASKLFSRVGTVAAKNKAASSPSFLSRVGTVAAKKKLPTLAIGAAGLGLATWATVDTIDNNKDIREATDLARQNGGTPAQIADLGTNLAKARLFLNETENSILNQIGAYYTSLVTDAMEASQLIANVKALDSRMAFYSQKTNICQLEDFKYVETVKTFLQTFMDTCANYLWNFGTKLEAEMNVPGLAIALAQKNGNGKGGDPGLQQQTLYTHVFTTFQSLQSSYLSACKPSN